MLFRTDRSGSGARTVDEAAGGIVGVVSPALLVLMAAAALQVPQRSAFAESPGPSSIPPSGDATPSSVQPLPAPESVEQARTKLREGARLLAAGKYGDSLRLFEEAYTIVPNPKIHYNVGLAYVGLSRPTKALEAFERFLADSKDAPVVNRVEAERLVGELRPKVGSIAIVCEQAGAEVKVDGQPLGITPVPGKRHLDPGSHQLVARRGADVPFVRDFDLAPGQDLTLTVTMAAALVATPPSSAPADPLAKDATTSDTPDSGRRRWLIWGIAGGVVVVGAIVAAVLLGGGTSYPKPDGQIMGN